MNTTEHSPLCVSGSVANLSQQITGWTANGKLVFLSYHIITADDADQKICYALKCVAQQVRQNELTSDEMLIKAFTSDDPDSCRTNKNSISNGGGEKEG